MSPNIGKRLTRLVISCFLLMLVLIVYIFYQSYEGRANLVEAQRSACERAKLDRAANAAGWRNAEQARRADGDIEVANEYAKIAEGLETRSEIDCLVVFPDAGVFP